MYNIISWVPEKMYLGKSAVWLEHGYTLRNTQEQRVHALYTMWTTKNQQKIFKYRFIHS